MESYEEIVDRTVHCLQRAYIETVLPLEVAYDYDVLRPSWFSNSITQKQPLAAVFGPFSSGKSTFINYLIGANLLPTGPQRLTDRFNILMYGEEGYRRHPWARARVQFAAPICLAATVR